MGVAKVAALHARRSCSCIVLCSTILVHHLSMMLRVVVEGTVLPLGVSGRRIVMLIVLIIRWRVILLLLLILLLRWLLLLLLWRSSLSHVCCLVLLWLSPTFPLNKYCTVNGCLSVFACLLNSKLIRLPQRLMGFWGFGVLGF